MTGTTTAFAASPHEAAEMNHRIANNLALLASLIEIDSREIADPGAVVVLEAARNRIHAIANVHRRLYKIEAIDHLDLCDFIEDLARDLRSVCENAGRERRLYFEGTSVFVTPDEASAIGILVAELVGNACKHAYPASAAGVVRIGLSGLEAGGWCLTVEDEGRGYSPGPSGSNAGLGSRIIGASVGRLGATCRWEDAMPGTRFVMHYGPTLEARPPGRTNGDPLE
ncbi:sensor histidine kinase [Sphingomonas sp. H39-1-10]|uniref:sensor histidine kinase n=1 Tax=Sphingomonas pollutisoli TaxID=3030829 RepID=UPI0023B93F62|nr:sensor histidine kinase [Sphingomonas pollutisoli]MDF0489959.1 sensor histidine kinase [Sphingomonas pollutisoli]